MAASSGSLPLMQDEAVLQASRNSGMRSVRSSSALSRFAEQALDADDGSRAARSTPSTSRSADDGTGPGHLRSPADPELSTGLGDPRANRLRSPTRRFSMRGRGCARWDRWRRGRTSAERMLVRVAGELAGPGQDRASSCGAPRLEQANWLQTRTLRSDTTCAVRGGERCQSEPDVSGMPTSSGVSVRPRPGGDRRAGSGRSWALFAAAALVGSPPRRDRSGEARRAISSSIDGAELSLAWVAEPRKRLRLRGLAGRLRRSSARVREAVLWLWRRRKPCTGLSAP